MAPSRDQLSTAIGKIIMLKLSKEDTNALLKDVSTADDMLKPDWDVISHFTRQALTSVEAARTLSTHFVREAKVLHEYLESQVFIGGKHPVVADIVCCIALVPAMAAFPDEHKWALCNASRWFDHVQHLVASLKPPSKLTRELVSFTYNMPTPPPAVSSLPVLITAPGGGAAAAATAPTGSAASSAQPAAAAAAEGRAKGAPATGGEAKPEGKSEAKLKKEKEKAEKKEKAPKPAEGDAAKPAGPTVAWADLRVGKIVDAKNHPESDKLYVETIDLGEEKPRQILSGLAHHMKLDEVKGAMVVVIANLKERNIGGMKSAGMVLCAGSADKTKLGFVTPPAGAAPGERVMFEGFEVRPSLRRGRTTAKLACRHAHAAQLPYLLSLDTPRPFVPSLPQGEPESASKMDKKKAWEAIQPELNTSAEGVCRYKELPFTLAGGVCTATVPDGGIS